MSIMGMKFKIESIFLKKWQRLSKWKLRTSEWVSNFFESRNFKKTMIEWGSQDHRSSWNDNFIKINILNNKSIWRFRKIFYWNSIIYQNSFSILEVIDLQSKFKWFKKNIRRNQKRDDRSFKHSKRKRKFDLIWLKILRENNILKIVLC